MQNSPDWVFDVSDEDLAQRFDPVTRERAREYVREGRVGSVTIAGPMVMAEVVGGGRHTYRTSVVQTGRSPYVATCTCPVRRDCKHAVALMLVLRESEPAPRLSRWQQVLTPLLQQPRRTIGGVLLALQVNDTVDFGMTLRPLKRGPRGRWVKAGATWDDVEYHSNEFDPAQQAIVHALRQSRQQAGYLYGHRVDALPFNELRADAWGLLRRAGDVGIPIFAGEGPGRSTLPPVEISDLPVEPVVTVEPTDSGAHIIPALRIDGRVIPAGREALIGKPPHGVVLREEHRTLLAPLTRPLDDAERELFLEAGQLEVPADELDHFATNFLPQLRRRVNVQLHPDVVLPQAPTPVLQCSVDFGHNTATLAWSWRYPSAGVPVLPGAHPGGEPVIRQPEAEQEIASTIPEGPWKEDGFHGIELVSTTLTGRSLFNFIDHTLPELEANEDVDVVANTQAPTFTRVDEAPLVNLSVSDSQAGDWFNLGVDVTVAGEQVPFGPLFAALATGEDHLLLDSGTWFPLDRPELEQLRQLIDEARVLVDPDAHTFRLRPEHAGLWQELVTLGVVTEQSQAWQEAVEGLLDVDSLPEVRQPAGLLADLRPYQATGFSWLSFLWRTRLGGILADEMGLGKTLQALALAQAAAESDELQRPMLVVAPTSVIGTWVAEAARFVPELTVVAIEATANRRGSPLHYVMRGANIVVTSYALLRLDAEQYEAHQWSVVLLDEAQFVKNRASKAYQAVRRLRARVKIALTGTPLENNLMDLWSLLSITAPGLFPDPKVFAQIYRKPIEAGDTDVLARLHTRIRPLILRRTKAAVASELPEKQEQILSVPLSETHRRLYDKHLARERQKVLGLVDDLSAHRITILRSLTLLRQLSLAPSLIDPTYPAQSAKIDVLVEMLQEIMAEGHRALVFSQFTSYLSLVRERFDEEKISYEYLDGRTRDRPARIAAFREGDAPVFLISLKAGGFGLTLTEADYVFILDPWWNPAAEAQAVDRTHRIGQTERVNVYRLVAADTIEEKVVALQQRKRNLFDQVVGTASDMAAPLSADDIRGLLED